MRIIAGKHKNRVIPTSKKADYRPSTTKFREALFSILSSGEFSESLPLQGADVLDLFAGAGSLSFEALSREANSVTLVDVKSEYLKLAVEFAQKIGEGEKVFTLATSATSLPFASRKYSLVFMDPPYHNDFIDKSLKSLVSREWLEKDAIIVIEMSKYDKFEILDEFICIKEKIYGNNKLLVLRYNN